MKKYNEDGKKEVFGINKGRIRELKGRYQKPEVIIMPEISTEHFDCSDMASCAGLTMCYC